LVRAGPPGRVPGQRSDRRGRFDGGLGSHHGHGRDDLHGTGGVAHYPLLPQGVLRPVHTVPGRLGLGGKSDAPHRGRRRQGGRPRPSDGHLRQHRRPGSLASGPDHDMPSRPVDPEPGSLGDPDVPRRVLGPHPPRPLPSSHPTGCKRAPLMPDPCRPATKSPPPLAPTTPARRWSSHVEPDGVTITLDGRQVTAKKGEMLIAAAERAGRTSRAFATTPA
jgi:hypothetical protein